MHVSAHFAPGYAPARAAFVAAAERAGLALHAYVHPLLGHDGETLALDAARFGADDAPALLVVSSGCHGVEGLGGAGVQRALLADPGFHRAAAAARIAVLYLHALNPYGFSWLRRATHENVDLNRNFLDFSRPLPANPAYDRISHLVVPAEWPPNPEVKAGLAAFVAEHGQRALHAAIASGQYEHPQGLFFGGHNPSWSNQTVRQVLRDHGRRCRRLAWLDLHSGLGPSGHGQRIWAGPDAPTDIARARDWWGEELVSTDDGSAESPRLTGTMWTAVGQECAQAEYTGIALEFGTQPLEQVLDALRAEQWLENHPETPAARRTQIKRQLRDAFYVDTDAWKARVVAQGMEAAYQAIAGLRG